MSKVLTASQRNKIADHIWGRLTDPSEAYEESYLTVLQESLLASMEVAVLPVIKEAIQGWEGSFEREENIKLKRLESENRELKKELKKYAVIKQMIDEASGEVS